MGNEMEDTWTFHSKQPFFVSRACDGQWQIGGPESSMYRAGSQSATCPPGKYIMRSSCGRADQAIEKRRHWRLGQGCRRSGLISVHRYAAFLARCDREVEARGQLKEDDGSAGARMLRAQGSQALGTIVFCHAAMERWCSARAGQRSTKKNGRIATALALTEAQAIALLPAHWVSTAKR